MNVSCFEAKQLLWKKKSTLHSLNNDLSLVYFHSKIIHGVGAICPFDVAIADSPYSGLLKAGTTSGLIRLGAAADLFGLAGQGLTPGVSLKFLRSGVSSGNVMLLNSLDTLTTYNFFEVPLFNHISGQANSVGTIALAKKFCSAGHCISKVGISNLCSHDQDGNQVKDIEMPFKISLSPADITQSDDMPSDMQDFMNRFTSIPVGSRIYTLKAHANPDDSEGTVLGDLVTTDNCVTSKYGDTKLAFKHQWIDDDANIKPEWSDAYYYDCGCDE